MGGATDFETVFKDDADPHTDFALAAFERAIPDKFVPISLPSAVEMANLDMSRLSN